MPHIEHNYFFIDGSSLMADIASYKRDHPEFTERRFKVSKIVDDFVSQRLDKFHGGSYKRFVFYFAKGDENRVQNVFELPNFTTPDIYEDIHIKYCGQKLQKSKEVNEWIAENDPPTLVVQKTPETLMNQGFSS
ncbi:MAG: hypothetical protein AAF902_25110 [Chloroflexota bacterium]